MRHKCICSPLQSVSATLEIVLFAVGLQESSSLGSGVRGARTSVTYCGEEAAAAAAGGGAGAEGAGLRRPSSEISRTVVSGWCGGSSSRSSSSSGGEAGDAGESSDIGNRVWDPSGVRGSRALRRRSPHEPTATGGDEEKDAEGGGGAGRAPAIVIGRVEARP